MKTWECKDCGKEIKSLKKPVQPCSCGARGKWAQAATLALSIVMLALTACNGPESTPSVSTAEVATVSEPTSTPTASPTPGPSVTPSPTPSPSPSATPAPYAFGGGSGTTADPYRLDTATDVEHIADYPSAVFSVTQDINMNGHPIVNGLTDFAGTLKGNGRQLYNLAVISTNGQNAALFRALTGTVDLLTLAGQFYVNGNGHVAAFATQLGGSLTMCRVTGTIDNQSPTYPIASVKSQILTLAYLPTGAHVITGTSYDVVYNGTRYTGSF